MGFSDLTPKTPGGDKGTPSGSVQKPSSVSTALSERLNKPPGSDPTEAEAGGAGGEVPPEGQVQPGQPPGEAGAQSPEGGEPQAEGSKSQAAQPDQVVTVSDGSEVTVQELMDVYERFPGLRKGFDKQNVRVKKLETKAEELEENQDVFLAFVNSRPELRKEWTDFLQSGQAQGDLPKRIRDLRERGEVEPDGSKERDRDIDEAVERRLEKMGLTKADLTQRLYDAAVDSLERDFGIALTDEEQDHVIKDLQRVVRIKEMDGEEVNLRREIDEALSRFTRSALSRARGKGNGSGQQPQGKFRQMPGRGGPAPKQTPPEERQSREDLSNPERRRKNALSFLQRFRKTQATGR